MVGCGTGLRKCWFKGTRVGNIGAFGSELFLYVNRRVSYVFVMYIWL